MSFAKAILTVSGITVLSRIAGFVRDTLAANMLGAGVVSDAFFVALRLPNLFRSLFAEGAFSAAFVPLYAKVKKDGGADDAGRFAGEALSFLIAVLLPFTVFVMLFMPQVMLVLAPGYEDKQDVFSLAITYGRITFPYLMLVSGVALLTGVLNSNRRFAPGAAAPILFNLFMIAALFLSKVFQLEPGLAMAVAVTVSGVVQWLWMHLHCKAMGVAPRLTFPRLTPRVAQLFKQVGPGAIGAGATQINLVMSTVLASLLPTGAVSYLFYADRLNQLPLGVIGIAISSTLLPVLSAKVQADDANGIRHYTTRALEFGLILGLPTAVGLGLAAQPIVEVLFQHGAFDALATKNTAMALAAYVFGVVPFILVKILASIFFAHHDTKTPVKTAMLAVVANIVCALALVGPFGHVGIAAATSIATWINFLLLAAALKKGGLLQVRADLLPRALKIGISAVAMALFLFFAKDYVETLLATPHKGAAVAVLAAYLGAAMLFYGLALGLTGALSLKELRAIALKKDEQDE